MKFTCLDSTGYEGRLTERKTYEGRNVFSQKGMISVTLDNGEKEEVFRDRFMPVQRIADCSSCGRTLSLESGVPELLCRCGSEMSFYWLPSGYLLIKGYKEEYLEKEMAECLA